MPSGLSHTLLPQFSAGRQAHGLLALLLLLLLLLLQSKLADGSSVLSKVQYLSSTSGGSWFNAAFSYKVGSP